MFPEVSKIISCQRLDLAEKFPEGLPEKFFFEYPEEDTEDTTEVYPDYEDEIFDSEVTTTSSRYVLW